MRPALASQGRGGRPARTATLRGARRSRGPRGGSRVLGGSSATTTGSDPARRPSFARPQRSGALPSPRAAGPGCLTTWDAPPGPTRLADTRETATHACLPGVGCGRMWGRQPWVEDRGRYFALMRPREA